MSRRWVRGGVRGFSSITLPDSRSFPLRLHAKISLRPTVTHHKQPPPSSSSSSSSSVPVRADACHGSSDVSCLLSCRSPLVVVQQHIQQGLCNSTASCMTAWQALYCRVSECVCVCVCVFGVLCCSVHGIMHSHISTGACVLYADIQSKQRLHCTALCVKWTHSGFTAGAHSSSKWTFSLPTHIPGSSTAAAAAGR